MKACVGCGAQLITQRRWNALGRHQRQWMREHGFARQFVGQSCSAVACQRAQAAQEAS